ncbi:ABCC3 isoform 20 [Pongo abelii]|uniref:ABCC3 isoform 20 n=1 Tax=Pongo abelii TaxID=9601 RepID=A0A2J8W8E7_PONAB|nr:ABCC3 isoform 20 [Pongo abelii]
MDALCGSGELGSKFWHWGARESEEQCAAGAPRHSAWLGELSPSQPVCRVRKGSFAISHGLVMEGLPSASALGKTEV